MRVYKGFSRPGETISKLSALIDEFYLIKACNSYYVVGADEDEFYIIGDDTVFYKETGNVRLLSYKSINEVIKEVSRCKNNGCIPPHNYKDGLSLSLKRKNSRVSVFKVANGIMADKHIHDEISRNLLILLSSTFQDYFYNREEIKLLKSYIYRVGAYSELFLQYPNLKYLNPYYQIAIFESSSLWSYTEHVKPNRNIIIDNMRRVEGKMLDICSNTIDFKALNIVK